MAADPSKVYQFSTLDLAAPLRKINTEAASVATPGIGNFGGPPVDPRVDVLEAETRHIKESIADLKGSFRELAEKVDSRFLWILGAYGAGFVAVVTIIISVTMWLGGKSDLATEQMHKVELAVQHLSDTTVKKP